MPPKTTLTILLVHAHSGRRSHLAAVLRKKHCRVLAARNVADALRRATGETRPIDILATEPVLLDGTAVALMLALDEVGHSPRVVCFHNEPELVALLCSGHPAQRFPCPDHG